MITDAEDARNLLTNAVDISGLLELIEEAAKNGKNSYTTNGELLDGKVAVLEYLGFKVDWIVDKPGDPPQYVNRIIW